MIKKLIELLQKAQKHRSIPIGKFRHEKISEAVEAHYLGRHYRHGGALPARTDGWIPDFIAEKTRKKRDKISPSETGTDFEKNYGVAVYQEQVMQIARDLAGFTLGEADVLRKAMGKKIFELIHEQKQKFIEGCVKQGVDQQNRRKSF